MRVLLVVVAFLAAIVAADISFTGITGGTFNYPTGLGSSCSQSSSTGTYALINVSFSTSGVRKIDAITQNNGQSLYLYQGGFNINNTCNYSIPFSDDRLYVSYSDFVDGYSSGASTGVYFLGGVQYFIAVYASSAQVFGINILESNATVAVSGNISLVNGNFWNNPYYSSSSATLSFTSYNTSFGTFAFSVATGGYYDLAVYVYNQTEDITASIALYQGDVRGVNVSGNYSAIFAPRDSTTGRYSGQNIYYAYLNAGATYTLVGASASSGLYDTEIGFFVRPTNVAILQSGSTVTGVYTQPNTKSLQSTSACTASSDDAAAYSSTQFNSQSPYVLVSFGESDLNEYSNNVIDGTDFVAYFYDYSNTVPTACPATSLGGGYLSGIDSYSSPSYDNDGSAGTTYTYILSPYSGVTSFTLRTGSLVKIYNGPALNPTPTTAPTPAPTGSPTTTPTTAPTSTPTAAPTTGPTSAPTSRPTSAPTTAPTATPTTSPTATPTAAPTTAPSTTGTTTSGSTTSGSGASTAPSTTSGAAPVVASIAVLAMSFALLL